MTSQLNNSGPTPSRRQLLAGGAAVAVTTWAAPSIARIDRVMAAAGTCIPQTIRWQSVSGNNPNWTATGSSGSVTITATIAANLSPNAVPSVFISGGRLLTGMRQHQIGDSWSVQFSFTDSAGGTICQASVDVIDIDQNGRGLGCPTNSRFRDVIHSITGPLVSTTLVGNMTESPAGVFYTLNNCKTGDTENMTLNYSSTGNVVGAGFTYMADTPPGNDPNLDYQLIKMSPMTVCVSGNTGGFGAIPNRAVPLTPTKLQAGADVD